MKTIYISQADTNDANLYNENGIEAFNIFPNPNNGNLNISILFQKSQESRILIYNHTGTVVFSKTYAKSLEIIDLIDLQAINFETGIYYFRIVSEYDSQSTTLITSF